MQKMYKMMCPWESRLIRETQEDGWAVPRAWLMVLAISVKTSSGIVYLLSSHLFCKGTKLAWRAPRWLGLEQGDEKEEWKDRGV